MNVKKKESWMSLIINYLKWGNIANDKKEIRMVEHRSVYFFIENYQLYKKGFALPSL